MLYGSNDHGIPPTMIMCIDTRAVFLYSALLCPAEAEKHSTGRHPYTAFTSVIARRYGAYLLSEKVKCPTLLRGDGSWYFMFHPDYLRVSYPSIVVLSLLPYLYCPGDAPLPRGGDGNAVPCLTFTLFAVPFIHHYYLRFSPCRWVHVAIRSG